MAAVLNAITGGKDFSNGAIRWDGFDLAIKGWEHVKSKNQGLGISRSHYQTFYSYWAGGNRLKMHLKTKMPYLILNFKC